MTLKNVQLRPDALYALGLPLSIRSSRLGQVRLTIPWKRLGREPVVISIDGVVAIASLLDQNEEETKELQSEWAWQRKQRKVRALWAHAELGEESHAVLKDEEDKKQMREDRMSSMKEEGSTKLKKKRHARRSTQAMATRIVNNIQLTLTNLHLRIEDSYASPSRRSSFGLTLDKASVRRRAAPTAVPTTSRCSQHELHALPDVSAHADPPFVRPRRAA